MEPLGAPWVPLAPKNDQRGTRERVTQCVSDKKASLGAQKGAVLRLEIESKTVLISGPEKVNDIEAQKLAKRSLGTSKIKEFHWRGCYFLVFTLFSCESIF